MRRLELVLAGLLAATLLAGIVALQLPRARLPRVAAPAPDEVAAAEGALWPRLVEARERGAICAGRPVPPVPAVRRSRALDDAARARAEALAAGVDVAPPARISGFRGRRVVEVVLRGGEGWLDRPGCGGLLDPTATHGGAGSAVDPAGGSVDVVWLGRRRR